MASRMASWWSEFLQATALIALLLILPWPACADGRPAASGPQCVILLHGLGRTHRSMEPMAEALTAAGFDTFNLDYDSREHPIEELAMQVIPQGLQRCSARGAATVHFVTHSMGGILVRYYLSRKSVPELGRVVMLSPPNKGSEVTDALRDSAFYQWYNGPAGQQLGTTPGSFVTNLGPVRYPVGIITGSEHAFFDFWLSDLIPGPDDGKVSVERAKVEGMADFLVLPFAHPFIMEAPEVIEQTIQFLKQGCFRCAGNQSKGKTVRP